MCNKRRSLSKNNVCSRNLWLTVLVLIISIHWISCSEAESAAEKSETILTDYPVIADAISERDFNLLLSFTEVSSKNASEFAWRALAKTESDNLDAFVKRSLNSDSADSWYALSYHPLSDKHLSEITEAYISGHIESSGVCEIFRRHGNQLHIGLMLEQSELLTSSVLCALAVGTIMTRHEVEDQVKREIIDLAFSTKQEEIRRNLLYGFYRSALNRPEPESDLSNELAHKWELLGVGIDNTTDPFMVRTLGVKAVPIVMNQLTASELTERVQLSVELASVLQYADTDALNEEWVDRLLNHKNAHVVIQVLESLRQHDTLQTQLLEQIRREFTGPARNSEIFLSSLALLQENGSDISPFLEKLEYTAEKYPFFTDRILLIYRNIEGIDRFLSRIEENLEKGEIKGLHAARALTKTHMEFEDDENLNEKVRTLVLNGLEYGDRSVLTGLTELLREEKLFHDDDFEKLNEFYALFVERQDRDKIEMMDQALEERYPERFKRLTEVEDKPFRIPDWERLYEMGTRPYWILETGRGTIEVKLDPLSAPFTVSSIDSLTRAGAYDGVALHRVVRNFVVQGGDFERRDGLGGPDYRIPTEPSFKSFGRGAAGIASSGTDTEGSQFFFMHQWAPHLDGHYTRFGEVVRGMDVVDKIQVGDTVKKARISIR
jgi:cyclophilin family peptidyl-prolyl cis-trans isomerase